MTGATGGTGAAGPTTFQSMADKLTLGLLTVVVGAIGGFVSAFLTWSTVDAHAAAGSTLPGLSVAVTDSVGISGDRLGAVTLICSIVAVTVVGLLLLPPAFEWLWQVLLGLGALVVLLALIEVVTLPRALGPAGYTCPSATTCTFHRTIGPGVWFTLVAGLIVIAGAYLHRIRPVPFLRPEPVMPPDAADQPVKAAAEEAAPA